MGGALRAARTSTALLLALNGAFGESGDFISQDTTRCTGTWASSVKCSWMTPEKFRRVPTFSRNRGQNLCGAEIRNSLLYTKMSSTRLFIILSVCCIGSIYAHPVRVYTPHAPMAELMAK